MNPPTIPAVNAITPNCEEGRHNICKCELPGQDKRYAGLFLRVDDRGELVPGGFCECECHADEMRAG